MKFTSLLFMLLSLNCFAHIVEPTVEKCADDFNLLTMVQAPVAKHSTTVSGDINVFALAHSYGDPVMWTELYKVGITFPVIVDEKTEIACFVINRASASSMKKIKSIAYDAKKGRLLSIPVVVATYDDTGIIGSAEKTLKVRIDKADQTVTLE